MYSLLQRLYTCCISSLNRLKVLVATCRSNDPRLILGLPYHLQEYAKVHDRLACFLTYADNNAVGYFTKQGFSTKITLPSDRVNSSFALFL